MRTDELDYHLPDELVATRPADPRDSARLLVISRSDPDRLEHRTVRDLPDLLAPGDLAVFNRSRVVHARFLGHRTDTMGRVEGLFLREPEPGVWVAMLKARRFRPGTRLALRAAASPATSPADFPPTSGYELELLERADEPGAWLLRVHPADAPNSLEVLDRVGLPPLPPYIRAARARAGDPASQLDDPRWYQTVYASEPGSVAAPTAGLHFTPELLDALTDRGVARAEVTLHVGTGTFKPVETDILEDHPMHTEWCSIPRATLEAIRARRAGGSGCVLAIGTTSARTLEGFAQLEARHPGEPLPDHLETDILISPGYAWRWTDALLTNFHLPRSTLLAMVAALLPEGIERLLEVYRVAVAERYRFYSFGDAMLVLP
ncbi:MAG: tRNA preQ1(34) S-adenosylmethionine ribosyltransferase-isomerase QueA [Phycisphaerales bacterium JB037]